jgi:hypothetical protein
MGVQYQAANLIAPFGDNVAVTNVRYFTCDSTSKTNAIPDAWCGKYVLITNDSANAAQFFFSKASGASCDETIAATAAGASSVSLGGYIAGGGVRHMRVPSKLDGETMYFVRASVSAATLRMELGSQ